MADQKFYARNEGWTKSEIFDTLDSVDSDCLAVFNITVADITDDDAQWFAEQDFKNRADFPEEENYVDSRDEYAHGLLNKIKARR